VAAGALEGVAVGGRQVAPFIDAQGAAPDEPGPAAGLSDQEAAAIQRDVRGEPVCCIAPGRLSVVEYGSTISFGFGAVGSGLLPGTRSDWTFAGPGCGGTARERMATTCRRNPSVPLLARLLAMMSWAASRARIPWAASNSPFTMSLFSCSDQ
jgi:hypothetical protein